MKQLLEMIRLTYEKKNNMLKSKRREILHMKKEETVLHGGGADKLARRLREKRILFLNG
jgi:hypothetical protein